MNLFKRIKKYIIESRKNSYDSNYFGLFKFKNVTHIVEEIIELEKLDGWKYEFRKRWVVMTLSNAKIKTRKPKAKGISNPKKVTQQNTPPKYQKYMDRGG